MSNTQSSLNDVNLEAVGGLAAAVTEDPAKAQTVWSANVRWNGGFKSEATVRNFAPTPSDEPEGLGGGDTAPNPVEQLLAALGNCLAVGYAANASVAGIAIKELSINLEGDIDLRPFLGVAPGHAGFKDIRVDVSLVSDAPADQIAALHEKVAATSPVGKTLSAAVPLSIRGV